MGKGLVRTSESQRGRLPMKFLLVKADAIVSAVLQAQKEGLGHECITDGIGSEN